MWHSTKPTLPAPGDCYVDQKTGIYYTYSGTMWLETITGAAPYETRMTPVPSPENLDRHPALKSAWEEYLVVKKLLGV